MKKIFLICAFTLCLSLFTACNVNKAPPDSPDPASAVPAPSASASSAVPAGENTPAAAPAYFIIGGVLAGSWDNGAWRSINDTDGRDDARSAHDFYFKDVLSVPRFTLYSRNGRIGFSETVLVNAAEGVSGFGDGDKTGLFTPYALPDPGNRWPYSMEIKLPASFGPEMDGLKIPGYGYALRFSYESVDLATNSPDDLNAYGKISWGPYYSAEDADHAALREILDKNNIRAETNFDDTASADIDGDGAQDMLLFANTPRDENGYQIITPEDGGSYSVILMRKSDGRYETVCERYRAYTEDVTAQFNLHPMGIYDLNGDGSYEICAVMGEWESGYTFVLSRDDAGAWKTVLRTNWGN